MAFTKVTKDMDIIAALDDEPNDVGGLTAAQLKAKFDEGGKALKLFLNDTLIAELEAGSAGGSIGVSATGITATKLNAALAELKAAVDSATTGTLPAGSVTTEKIRDGNVTTAKIPDGAITTAKLAGTAVTAAKLAADAVETAKIKDGAVTSDKLAGASVVSGKIGVGAVATTNLADEAVTKAKMASASVGNTQLDTTDLTIQIANGGTGATTGDQACEALGAQKQIQSNSFSLPVASWTASGNIYTQTATVSGMTAGKAFVASPSDATSWDAAADADLYPPTAGSGSMTFTCKEIPSAAITVTVYFW